MPVADQINNRWFLDSHMGKATDELQGDLLGCRHGEKNSWELRITGLKTRSGNYDMGSGYR